MNKSNLVDLDLRIVHETKFDDGTQKSFLLTDERKDLDGYFISHWCPASQVENNNDGTFTMPEWLAIEKGFV